MILLVLSVVLSFVSLHHSALVEDSPALHLFRYHPKIIILSELLTKECPEYSQHMSDVTKQQTLAGQASLVKHLEQQLLNCRENKLFSPTTRKDATFSNTVTDPTPFCPSYDGDSIFNMLLVGYNNPTNKKASGVLCKPDGSPCRISLRICISPINSIKCMFYNHVTDVKGEKSKISLIDNLGDLKNPVNINLGSRKWQGAHVSITVLVRNPAASQKVYSEVDKFTYNLTDAQGSAFRLVTLHGKRSTDKTELVVMFTVPCPSPSTTLPTTPSTTLSTTPSTTLPTTTTSPPIPAECHTATNLSQPWRFDHGGRDFKGKGPYSFNGYACDRYEKRWFRFTGAAGTHMLDKCPKYKSCGTLYPSWTDETAPQAVGVAANISAYQVRHRCKHYTIPLQVMRCSLSTDHDLIYKYNGPYIAGADRCGDAFCGMK